MFIISSRLVKSKQIKLALTAFALLAATFLSGCTSYEHYVAERRQRLLTIYPPNVTTRADVMARWHGRAADYTYQRPSAGWAAHEYPYIGQRCLTSEQRTGKQVASCESRYGADGLFNLCDCWFYYDRRNRVLDADWVARGD